MSSATPPGYNRIVGTEGYDRIMGTPGNDVIFALGGNDAGTALADAYFNRTSHACAPA